MGHELKVYCKTYPLHKFTDIRYQTRDGELDILDNCGVAIHTFAKGEWLSVSRTKDENVEWPVDIYERDKEEFYAAELANPVGNLSGPY